MRPVEVNREPVRAVRLGQFSTVSPRIARLVLDLSSRAPYRIVEGADGMKIVFGEGETPRPAPLASLRTEPEEIVVQAEGGAAAAVGRHPSRPRPGADARTGDRPAAGPGAAAGGVRARSR